MSQPISRRFPTPSIGELPEDIRSRLLAVQEKSGFIPNVFLTLAYRPDEFRAFFAYHDALMERDSGLTKAEREMIVVATSSANQCHYCVVAHGAILRIRAKNPQIADQIAVNYRKADITPRQRAMLDFAMKVSTQAHLISETDFADIASHGFTDDDVWDIAAISAFFCVVKPDGERHFHASERRILHDGTPAEIGRGPPVTASLEDALILRGSAPARQIDRILAFRQSQRFLEAFLEIAFHALA